MGGGSCNGYFLHTMTMLALGSPRNILTSPRARRHRILDMAMPISKTHIHSGLHTFRGCSAPFSHAWLTACWNSIPLWDTIIFLLLIYYPSLILISTVGIYLAPNILAIVNDAAVMSVNRHLLEYPLSILWFTYQKVESLACVETGFLEMLPYCFPKKI